jgi:lysyl-tRNA synthetase class I
MFKLLYLILLGVPRGPKAGTLVSLIGVPRVRDLIAKELSLP